MQISEEPRIDIALVLFTLPPTWVVWAQLSRHPINILVQCKQISIVVGLGHPRRTLRNSFLVPSGVRRPSLGASISSQAP